MDEQDSDGGPGLPLQMSQRLMAQAIDESIWYGFVVVGSKREFLKVGESSRVDIAFLDDEGARNAFPIDTVFRFGDGVRTRGTIELQAYLF